MLEESMLDKVVDPAPRTRRVTDFVRDLQWEGLPGSVQTQAVRCVLDLCGATLAGSRTKAAQVTAGYVQSTYGSGFGTVVGTPLSTTPPGAALINGVAGNALDLDDGYRPVKGHPGSVVFPAALAAAELATSTGRELLTALVIGYEVALRAGLVLHRLYGFYHGTGAWGPLGASAAAARLLGSDQEMVGHALGIAEFHAPMTPEMRQVDRPAMGKDGIGWGAMVGLTSAQLAEGGFTGIPSLFDEQGLETDVTAGFGRNFLIEHLYFKPYACCRWAQPGVEGALAATRGAGIDNNDDITRVRVHTFEAALHLRSVAPATTEEAQLSLPWAVACALIDGAVGVDQVSEHALEHPARRALAARVEMLQDAELEAAFPERALAWVEIEMSDGRRLHSGAVPARGDADHPLSDAELENKFNDLARPVLGSGRADELLSLVRALPEASSVEAFTAGLSTIS